MVTRFVVNYYILPIDANASARQNVVITTFCNVTTFWVATRVVADFIEGHIIKEMNFVVDDFFLLHIFGTH